MTMPRWVRVNHHGNAMQNASVCLFVCRRRGTRARHSAGDVMQKAFAIGTHVAMRNDHGDNEAAFNPKLQGVEIDGDLLL
jgi:hypothetical protein